MNRFNTATLVYRTTNIFQSVSSRVYAAYSNIVESPCLCVTPSVFNSIDSSNINSVRRGCDLACMVIDDRQPVGRIYQHLATFHKSVFLPRRRRYGHGRIIHEAGDAEASGPIGARTARCKKIVERTFTVL